MLVNRSKVKIITKRGKYYLVIAPNDLAICDKITNLIM